jgi:hypothetical protein
MSDKRVMPIVNGSRIHAIYGRMETAFRTDQILEDAYNQKPDYYVLCTEDTQYINNKTVKKTNIKTKVLPKEIAVFFGIQELNGNKLYVTRMYFDNERSEKVVELSGGCGAQHKSIRYFRSKRNGQDYPMVIFEGDELSNQLDNILGKKFEVEVCPEEYDIEYQCSYIRKEGGLNYPDLKLFSWRWLYGHPYVSNKYNENGQPDLNNIRVFFEPMMAHLYLTKVTELIDGDENLIQLNFKHSHDKKPDQFCTIHQWSHTKEQDPNGIIRYKILNKTEFGLSIAAMINDIVQFKQDVRWGYFYKIQSISRIL